MRITLVYEEIEDEIEDELLIAMRAKRKRKARTRGPYRKAFTLVTKKKK